ncbi:MAG: mutL [Deltaproteobacteria bacterium]|nr:mutL [Deltaproteobacteria bacterium]
MGIIRALASEVVAKIAAGEVVERPASVVKELVENALDAGATEIKIEIQGGGRKLIRVTDNGEGMSPEDALLAVERHTTSKISSAADLFAVQTFGFRGEALSAIAAVSKMKIFTGRDQGLAGFEIHVEGGSVIQSREAAASKGTSVEVRHLFFNVPVRLKFLKSPGTELGHISDTIARLALANDRVRFQLFHEGRLLAHYPLRPEAAARLAEALGREAGEKMYRFSYRNGEVEIAGYAGEPGYNRSNTRGVYLFVNRRPVRDRLLYHAVQEAYRPLLAKERNPVVLLFVNLPAGDVDVNVHPSKGEVKFVDPDRVHRSVISAIRQMLESSPWHSKAVVPLNEARESGKEYSSSFLSEDFPLKGLGGAQPGWNPAGEFPSGKTGFGQIRKTYLVLTTDDGITLIDQHAAHERITVEKLQDQFFEKEIRKQLLMMPETLELPLSEAQVVMEHIQDLDKMGFSLEPAGERTFWVRAVPEIVASREPLQILQEMIGEISSWGKGTELNRQFSTLIHMLACRGAVQASQTLRSEEALSLLEQLEKCISPARCPHGRPTFIKISADDLDKMFQRKK